MSQTNPVFQKMVVTKIYKSFLSNAIPPNFMVQYSNRHARHGSHFSKTDHHKVIDRKSVYSYNKGVMKYKIYFTLPAT